MRKGTKASLAAWAVVLGFVGSCLLLTWLGVSYGETKIAEARGPKLFAPGQAVTIKMTGERAIITGVYGHYDRWHYRCRVAFGTKNYPIGVITNPTQITKTYELVDFYGFELKAR